jgi:three-Cys-motif partner protein
VKPALVDPTDGLPILGVGPWSAEKHDYLRRYIGATRAVRGRFLPPVGTGGSAFIDLFAGPGRAQVHDRNEIIDGSPMIAAGHRDAPFTHILLCEKDSACADALRQRLGGDSRVQVFEGDCNDEIDRIAIATPLHGLNLALVDPFGLTPLHFATLAKLARFERMDIMLHFPTGDMTRNLHQYENQISRFLGTDAWKKKVARPRDVPKLIDVLGEQLEQFGYRKTDVRSAPFHDQPVLKNTRNVQLYHLVLATKHERGEKIWRSVIRIEGSGQKRLW